MRTDDRRVHAIMDEPNMRDGIFVTDWPAASTLSTCASVESIVQ